MTPPTSQAAVCRGVEAEILHVGCSSLHLLLDSLATHGALSTHRVELRDGDIGANPHRHSASSEVFYVLSGEVDILAGDRLMTAAEGDVIVVPPGMVHAFGAKTGTDGELLVLITPGVERFEFFRQIAAIRNGQAEPSTLSNSGSRFDTYPAESALWGRGR